MLCSYAAPRLSEALQDESGTFKDAGRDSAVCETAADYCPRNPEESILYRVVAAELESFLQGQRLRDRQPLLAELYGASVSGRIATGPRAGRRVARVGDAVDVEALPSGRRCAAVAGYSVHAGVCVPAHDRMRLERMARYAGRPPLATERLSLLPDGRLLYRLKHRWRDGTRHVIYEPLELMERLAALVPPPRLNLTRYSGVLAPGATFRPLVVPQVDVQAPPPHAGCQGGIATTKTESGKANEKPGGRPGNYSWARLMTRVFEFDVLACPRCGARMRILAAINSHDAIRKILACLSLPTRAPPIAPKISDTDTAYSC